ncbi:MAG: carboxymuconolactone decarboxylase family protein [Microthrixaceae bacterium]|nr:carboxymuconolactone decarboxylase family protein [Microthrixaceae bacterium]
MTEAEHGTGGEMSAQRAAGLNRMSQVYGWDMNDGPGDFFGYTVDHLFADIWNRPGLSDRDRRLLLIGLCVGSGQEDVLDIQLPAALGNDELTHEQLREIVIFFAHYAGWPRAARMNNQVEAIIARDNKKD